MTDVVCAMICEACRVLVVQLGPLSHSPGKWEFPGGKVHAGEIPGEALIREIREELDIGVRITGSLEPVNYVYPGKMICLIPFLCTMESGNLFLKEHNNFAWVTIEQLSETDLLPADRALLLTASNQFKLADFLNSGELRP